MNGHSVKKTFKGLILELDDKKCFIKVFTNQKKPGKQGKISILENLGKMSGKCKNILTGWEKVTKFLMNYIPSEFWLSL